ncbi:unnamed protein product [Durusdinium trenchii]|uniref:Uncharacterized protein n=1 Tax=Durusdinium trenchii TaxID=1381693 RepID=A0ABP0HC98_9DINO
MGRGMEKFDCLLPAAESKATKESSAALFGSKYGLAQASTIYLGSLPPSCQSMTRQLLAVLLVTAAAQEISETQVGLDAAWQDAKLLLSFAVGIIFMRCLEVLAVGRDEHQGRAKTIDLYPFLT